MAFVLKEGEARATAWIDYDFEWDIPEYAYGRPVTAIAEKAFKDCPAISVNIPDTVCEIGPWAFYKCSRLKDIVLPGSMTVIKDHTFSSCFELESVVIPDTVKTIEEGAFEDCLSMRSVEIPESVRHIAKGAFSGCKSLKSVTIRGKIGTISPFAFHRCESLSTVVLPDTVDSIEAHAFSEGLAIKGLEIPEPVEHIGDGAFQRSGIQSVRIPKTTLNIERNAFSQCESLQSIDVHEDNAMYSSKDGVLYDKSGRELVAFPGGKSGCFTVPSDVESIVTEAFAYSGCLKSIRVQEGNKEFSSRDGILYDRSGRELIACPGGIDGEIVIPEGVRTIRPMAFRGCYGLTSIVIPDSMEHIGRFAFKECYRLAEAELPASLWYDLEEGTFNSGCEIVWR